MLFRSVHATGRHLTGDALMISLGVESEERQSEAILASRSPMTGPGVTTRSHEDRHDVVAKADRTFLLRIMGFDRNFCGLSFEVDRELCLSIVQRSDDMISKTHEVGVGEPVVGLGCDIPSDAIAVGGLNHKALMIPRMPEADSGGEHIDPNELAFSEDLKSEDESAD